MAKSTSTEEQILERLDRIINLLALQASSGANTITEAARSLKLAGLDNQTIAEVLNVNVTVVRSLTTNLRVKPSQKTHRQVIMSNAQERTERLLALILLSQMKGASQREKAVQLNIAGFSNVEIADLLETSAEVIAHVLYLNRKGKTGVRAKKKTTGE